MLVSELRTLLQKYNAEELRVIVTELYKSMPKKLREEKDTDHLLQDVHGHMCIGKNERLQNKQADIRILEPQVELFIDYAYKQYFFAPNSYIHKKERPKWRFKVKEYIKDLQSIPVEANEGSSATELLEKLYKMLCHACRYYLFNTQDPYRSVGIGQQELFSSIAARKLGCGINRESVKSLIELLLTPGMDYQTTYGTLIYQALSLLRTPDSKLMAIDQCKALKIQMVQTKPPKKNTSNFDSEYVHLEKIEALVDMVAILYMALCEYEEGIKYYQKNTVEKNKEISLYLLLRHLYSHRLKDHWLRVYEEAVNKGIVPRDSLRKTYQYIQNNGDLPD